MIATLERELINKRQTKYKPADGFEDFLGNIPIKISKLETPVLEKNSKIESLQILSLETKSGFKRKIALLESIDGHKAVVYFYQDDFDPKRDRQKDYLSDNVFGDIATVGQINVISSTPEKNENGDAHIRADQLAIKLANNSKKSGIKGDNEIRLSGSGIVVVTNLDTEEFYKFNELHQAIGELFVEQGVFNKNLILPGINTKKLIENMEIAGAKTMRGPDDFPNLITFLGMILSEINPQVTEEMLFHSLPLLSYVPYHAHYLTPESKDLLIGFASLNFEQARIRYIGLQVFKKIKELFPEFISKPALV